MIGRGLLIGVAALACARLAQAQDTTPPPREGVRVGITYQPGVRPGMLVLGAPPEPLLDSVRAILSRDLDFSDQFEVITLPSDDSLVVGIQGTRGAPTPEFVNYRLYGALGADYAVRVRQANEGAVQVTVYDVRGAAVRRDLNVVLPPITDAAFRMRVHRLSDDVVQATSGQRGSAATRLAFLQGTRVYRIDADGADPQPLSPATGRAFSPAWAPDGRRVAYTEFRPDGGGGIYLLDVASGSRRLVAPTGRALNYTPTFSPNGRTLLFTRSSDDGTDIFSYDIGADCCLQRLTVGRFADNLSPTMSPDGGRIAFVSTRAGLPQIYVMAADGTGQELFAPFDYGVTGSSNAPEWSPDGTSIAFHRDVGGTLQVFVMDVASRTVRQLTSAGRNEDPTWAPDGRHLAFVSNRTGSRQLWVIDLETGRIRQLTRGSETRLPAWSLRID
jgi:TolB protein